MAKIFIASRFDEFQPLRAALVTELNDLPQEFKAIDLHDHRARPVGPRNHSVATVAESEIVILLLGLTYSDDDVCSSITEAEYATAAESNKSIFAYYMTGDADPRAQQFFERVKRAECATFGDPLTCTDNDTGAAAADAKRIIDDIREYFGNDGDEQSTTLGESVLAELRYLGAGDLSNFCLGPEDAAQEPAYVQLIERRRLGLQALAANDVSAAIKQLNEAASVYELDWATNFTLALTLDLTARTDHLKEAISRATRAFATAEDLRHAPRDLNDDELLRRRRAAASLMLKARLCRRAGNFDDAQVAVNAALERQPVSRTALTERLLISAAREDPPSAEAALVELLKIYPDHAVRQLRSAATRPLRAPLERHAVNFLRSRIALAQKVLGTIPAQNGPASPAQALEELRSCADAEQNKLTELISAAVALLYAIGDAAFAEKDVDQLQSILALADNLAANLGCPTETPERASHWIDAEFDRAHRRRRWSRGVRQEQAGQQRVADLQSLVQARDAAAVVAPKLAEARGVSEDADRRLALAKDRLKALSKNAPDRENLFESVVPILAQRFAQFDNCFAPSPALALRHYVPWQRAQDGDLTVIRSSEPPGFADQGLLADQQLPRRVVRVQAAGRSRSCSDLAMVSPVSGCDAATLHFFEQGAKHMLKRLELTAADAAASIPHERATPSGAVSGQSS